LVTISGVLSLGKRRNKDKQKAQESGIPAAFMTSLRKPEMGRGNIRKTKREDGKREQWKSVCFSGYIIKHPCPEREKLLENKQ
jgi:hypothetical protein